MKANPEIPGATLLVDCPDLSAPFEVRVERDRHGIPHVIGCSRYWGGLVCDAPCEAEAVAAFEHLTEAEAAAHVAHPVYCGRVNEGAPRPRERSAKGTA